MSLFDQYINLLTENYLQNLRAVAEEQRKKDSLNRYLQVSSFRSNFKSIHTKSKLLW